MAAEKAAAAPATRQAAAAQQQAVPSGHHPAAAAPAPLSAAASAPAVLPTSAAPSGRAPAAAAAELSKAPAAAAAVSRRNGGSPRAGTEAGGFAFAASPGLGGCPTPAPLGNPPRLRLSGPAQSAVQRQLDLAEATGAGGSGGAQQQQQAAAASGMGARQSAPKAVAFTSPNAMPPLSPSGAPPLSPLSATPGTPSELRAASEALLTAAAGRQPGAAPSPSREPAAFLEALLARLSQLNHDGFFENPVDEEEAPGYYDFVKQPLCFRDMRERLRRRQYSTWGALCDDFELICANALSFNQKRSRVHRAAVTMMQAGRLLLQTSEPAGKTAIAALHPDGAKAAAADARREKFDPRSPAGGGPMLRSASSPGTPPAGLASMSLGDTATTPEASDDALRDEAMDTDDEGYSSFSDMEPDPGPGYLGSSAPPRLAASSGVTTRSGLRAGANGVAAANGLVGGSGRKPGGGNGMTGAAAAAAAAAAALPDLGSVLKSISVGATRLLWPPGIGEAELRSAADAAALSHEEATSGPSTSGTASGAAAIVSDGADKPAAGGQKAHRGRSHAGQGQRKVRTTAWKTARRGIEWRARWLQLRLQGLQHLRDRHAEALAELRARDRVVDEDASTDQAAAPAAAETKPAVKAEPTAAAAEADAKGDARADAAAPAADLPVAMAAKQRAAANAEAAAVAAAAKKAAAAPAAAPQQQPPPRKARRRRLPVPDVSAAELASHPWFAAHAAAGRPMAGNASAAAAAAVASGDRLRSGSATGLPAEDDNVWYAGRCYALLDLIDRQRIMTRRMAASMCQMQEAGQQPEAAAGRARASSGANGQRSRGGMRPGSGRVRTTGPPAKPSKRRRDDVSEPGTPLLTHGIGAPKFVERQQAMEIPLPQVRRLSQAELAARRAAVAAWRARLKQQHAPSGGVRPAAGKAAAAAAGSSSEEDSGDEAFLQRHRPLEMEERQRFLSYTVGGNMKARAKGGPGHKPKPAGGNPRSIGGSRPDSAPARTATAPPALTTAPDAKSGGGTSEADAAGARKGGTTRRTSRESEKQRNRGRSGGSTRSGSRSPLLHLQSVGAGGGQPQDGTVAEKGAEKGTAGGGAAAAAVSGKGGAGAGAAASGKAHGRKE